MDRSPRRPWSGGRVVLGVCGGIAAYKVVQLARDLARLGAEVDVVLTRAAREFVGAASFEGVTGRTVRSEIFEPGRALDHIRLAREADVVCVAPATADFMARAAEGRANDLLAAVLLATRAPVLLCPAMNDAMWNHPRTARNAGELRELGYRLVGPATGDLAYGEGAGPGRMEEPATIVEHIGRALSGGGAYAGLRVLVTSGPTREPVDGVRYLSNRSSGRMGHALATAAWRRGAEVVFITGPSSLPEPVGARVRRVETAAEMEGAVREEVADADALLMAAAVADFRPASPVRGKIKKGQAPTTIQLEAAPDVLLATREARPPRLAVLGFALEVGQGRDSAREKLAAKGLDMVVLNDASLPGAGFEVATNRVTILDRDGGGEELPLLPKDEVADEVLDRFARYLPSLG